MLQFIEWKLQHTLLPNHQHFSLSLSPRFLADVRTACDKGLTHSHLSHERILSKLRRSFQKRGAGRRRVNKVGCLPCAPIRARGATEWGHFQREDATDACALGSLEFIFNSRRRNCEFPPPTVVKPNRAERKVNCIHMGETFVNSLGDTRLTNRWRIFVNNTSDIWGKKDLTLTVFFSLFSATSSFKQQPHA